MMAISPSAPHRDPQAQSHHRAITPRTRCSEGTTLGHPARPRQLVREGCASTARSELAEGQFSLDPPHFEHHPWGLGKPSRWTFQDAARSPFGVQLAPTAACTSRHPLQPLPGSL